MVCKSGKHCSHSQWQRSLPYRDIHRYIIYSTFISFHKYESYSYHRCLFSITAHGRVFQILPSSWYWQTLDTLLQYTSPTDPFRPFLLPSPCSVHFLSPPLARSIFLSCYHWKWKNWFSHCLSRPLFCDCHMKYWVTMSSSMFEGITFILMDEHRGPHAFTAVSFPCFLRRILSFHSWTTEPLLCVLSRVTYFHSYQTDRIQSHWRDGLLGILKKVSWLYWYGKAYFNFAWDHSMERES